MNIDLNEIRKRIDLIDEQIVALLNRRAAEIRKIVEIKTACGLPAFDPVREKEVYRRVLGESIGVIDDDALVRIFGQILAESRRLQLTAGTQNADMQEKVL